MNLNNNYKILKKLMHNNNYLKKISYSRFLFNLISVMWGFAIFFIIFSSFTGLFYSRSIYAEEFDGKTLKLKTNENSKQEEKASKVPFMLPLEGRITVSFREEYFDKDKKVTRKHTGIDIEGQFNQDVFASGNGIISYIGISPIGGRTVVIRHNEKIRTTYLNLLKIYVHKGQLVHQGDVIGTIGTEDDPSSFDDCHVHFGIIYDGFYLDPEDVLNIGYKSISKYISLKYLEDDFKLE